MPTNKPLTYDSITRATDATVKHAIIRLHTIIANDNSEARDVIAAFGLLLKCRGELKDYYEPEGTPPEPSTPIPKPTKPKPVPRPVEVAVKI